jgi:UDP-glucose 4-epimerase
MTTQPDDIKTVWIMGARGFIGYHLSSHFACLGNKVYGIGHGALSELEMRQFGLSGWINGEVEAANLDNLRELSGVPDFLYHLAGGSSVGPSIANPLEDFSRTVITTARLLDWMRSHAPETKIIAISSAAVYGGDHMGAINENVTLHAYSPYGHHKLMMEQICNSYRENFKLNVLIVRLFSVYGPRLAKQLLWDICCKISAHPDELLLSGTGTEKRDWTDVRDVVRLLEHVALLPIDSTLIFNGGTGKGTTVNDIAHIMLKEWNATVDVRFSGVARPGDPISLIADNALLAASGFEWKIDVGQGICNYVRWFREYWRG